MRCVKFLIAAGAASLLSSAAFAADMPSIMPAPAPYYAPPPQQDFGGWYLRGDIGMTNTKATLDDALYHVPNTLSVDQRGHEFTSGTSYGLGVGYQFNSWFRADVTGEYRSNVHFSGTDFATVASLGPGFGPGPFKIGDSYSGGYSSWVGMVNAYADLGTWWCITPFVGAGVGGAYNKTSGLSDIGNLPFGGSALYQAEGSGKWNLAWALHAGLAYKVNNNFTIELAYRYLDLGNVGMGNGSSFDGTNAGPSTFQYHDITSQDVRLGVRWTCCDLPPPPPPPLVRKG
jgi:opacity protein-like surface antigen